MLAAAHLDGAGRYRGLPGLPILQELDRRHPRDIGIQFNLGKCLAASGRRSEAVKVLRAGLRLRAKSMLYPADDPTTLQSWIRAEIDRLIEPERARLRKEEAARRDEEEGRRRVEDRRWREEQAACRAEAEAEARRAIVVQAEAALAAAARGETSLRAIFHTTHRSNLPAILGADAVLCFKRARTVVDIGDAEIKAARLQRAVPPAPGKVVADFVPFYFTSLTPMMYRVSCELKQRGQGKSDLVILVGQAERMLSAGISCYVTDRNARADGARHECASIDTLASVPNWEAIDASSWNGDEQARRDRQAEFLVADRVPLELLECLVVADRSAQRTVQDVLRAVSVDLPVEVRPKAFF